MPDDTGKLATRVSARSENRQGECQCTSVDAFCVRDISRIWNSCRSSFFILTLWFDDSCASSLKVKTILVDNIMGLLLKEELK